VCVSVRGNRCRDKGVLYSHVLVIDFPATRFSSYIIIIIIIIFISDLNSDLTPLHCHLILSFYLVQNDVTLPKVIYAGLVFNQCCVFSAFYYSASKGTNYFLSKYIRLVLKLFSYIAYVINVT